MTQSVSNLSFPIRIEIDESTPDRTIEKLTTAMQKPMSDGSVTVPFYTNANTFIVRKVFQNQIDLDFHKAQLVAEKHLNDLVGHSKNEDAVQALSKSLDNIKKSLKSDQINHLKVTRNAMLLPSLRITREKTASTELKTLFRVFQQQIDLHNGKNVLELTDVIQDVNELRDGIKLKYPTHDLYLPRVGRISLGTTQDILTEVASFSDDDEILNSFEAIRDSKMKWMFLPQSKTAYHKVLLKEFLKEENRTRLSQNLIEILKQYPFRSVDCHIDLRVPGFTANQIETFLSNVPHLTQVDTGYGLNLPQITFSKSLKKVSIGLGIRNDDFNTFIQNYPQLETINLHSELVTLENTLFSESLKELQVFETINVDFFGPATKNCKKLEKVTLNQNTKVPAASLPKSMKKLKLGSGFSDEYLLEVLKAYPELELLDLSEASDITLKNVIFSKSLKKLYLGNYVDSQFVAPAIEHCTQLEIFDCRDFLGKITLENVILPPSLREIWVGHGVTNERFNVAIRLCKSLKMVRSKYQSLEGVVLPESLEELDLSYNSSVTDEFLVAATKKCAKLKEINISGTKITLTKHAFAQLLKN